MAIVSGQVRAALAGTEEATWLRNANAGHASVVFTPTRQILVADSDPVVHAGIAYMLAGTNWRTVAVCAKTGQETVILAQATQPEMVLLGLRLPDSLADRIIRQLRESVPGVKIIMFAPRSALHSAIAAGVDGVIPKDADITRVLEIFGRVDKGEHVLDMADGADPRAGDADTHGLTRRERDILGRVAMGETNAEIARALGLATNTVKTYFQRALEKLGVRNRVEAVVYAREIGLL